MNDDKLKNIEKQLLKSGVAVCPNPTCTSSIISEEKDGRAGTIFLEYWCQNETCEYHKRRILNISIAKGLAEQVKSGFSSLGKRAIAGIVGLFLVIGATLGNYVPKWFGIAEEPSAQLEEIKKENEEMKTKINALLAKSSNKRDIGSGTSTLEKDQRIAALEERIANLQAEIDAVPVCQSDLKAKLKEAKELMKNGELIHAKNIFYSIYEDKRLRNSFLDKNNSLEKVAMVDLMADSYNPNIHKRFTYEYLKSDTLFAFFENFLEAFDVPKKELYYGRAYFNLHDNLERDKKAGEERKYKLTSLKYYLKGIREDPDLLKKSADHYVISAVNRLLMAYQLYGNKPSRDTVTITQVAQEKGSAEFLNNWINEIDGYIKETN